MAALSQSDVLKKFAGRPPSLVIHLHPGHFRFDGQDSVFAYKSPMKVFLEHLRAKTIPHDLLEYFIQANVPFYDGCLIVQVHDHKSQAQPKDDSKSKSASSAVVPSSIHNYNQYLTPSPYIPFPKDGAQTGGAIKKDDENQKEAKPADKDAESMPAPSLPGDGSKAKSPAKAKVFTKVMFPTQESLQADLRIKAATAGTATDGALPPSTPMSLVPPTPTAGNMPPPAKRQKKEKMELDGSNIYAVEGQILLETMPKLMLEPTKNAEETIALLEAWAHPSHSEPPPPPKSRRRGIQVANSLHTRPLNIRD